MTRKKVNLLIMYSSSWLCACFSLFYAAGFGLFQAGIAVAVAVIAAILFMFEVGGDEIADTPPVIVAAVMSVMFVLVVVVAIIAV